jgi:hypothetical protein
MARPLVTYPDIERAVVDLLAAALDDVTVGVGVPANWRPATGTHVEVSWDGTPIDNHPISMGGTVRVVAWAATKTEAKATAMLAHGHLLAYSGGGAFVSILPLTGPLPAVDPDHDKAELCSFTVRATVASTPIT